MATTTSDTNALRNRLSTQTPATAAAAGATVAPAKPWEQRLTSRTSTSDASGIGATSSVGGLGSSVRPTAQLPMSTSTAESGGLQAANSAYSTANSQMNGMMNQTGSMMNSGYGGASSYNSPGYGMGSTYGSTGYGSTGYGSTGYGGMSSYGGGMGSYGGGLGGYGGGYGSSYGGGYGMSRYGGGGYGGGGMMGGMGGMGGGMGGMDPNGQMGFLQTFSQTVGSLGQITEMLGMNAEALNFCVGSFVNFVERIGAMCAGMASMVTPRPDFPPGHPMHGQPPTEEEEKSRKRRVRIFQFLFSMVALTTMYKLLRWLGAFKSKARKALSAPPTPAMNRNLERIFQNTAGGRSRALLQ